MEKEKAVKCFKYRRTDITVVCFLLVINEIFS